MFPLCLYAADKVFLPNAVAGDCVLLPLRRFYANPYRVHFLELPVPAAGELGPFLGGNQPSAVIHGTLQERVTGVVSVLRLYVDYKLNSFLCRGDCRLVLDVVAHRPFGYGAVLGIRALDALCYAGVCSRCSSSMSHGRLVFVHRAAADFRRAFDVLFRNVRYSRILVLRHTGLHNPCEDILLRQ